MPLRDHLGQCKLFLGLTCLEETLSNSSGPRGPRKTFYCPCQSAGDDASSGRRLSGSMFSGEPPPCRLALSAGGGEGFSPALLARSAARTEKSLSSRGTGPGAVLRASGPGVQRDRDYHRIPVCTECGGRKSLSSHDTGSGAGPGVPPPNREQIAYFDCSEKRCWQNGGAVSAARCMSAL